MNHSIPSVCVSSDDPTPPNCHIQSCNACSALEKLDIKIMITQNQNLLDNPISKRYTLKSEVNYHHSRLIHRLPWELVSEIFVSCDSDHAQDWIDGIPPVALVLGGVCKLWRDVTLQTPQLWSSIKITFKDSHCDGHPYQLDMAKEWLRRSRSLLLNIHLDCRKYKDEDHPPNSNHQLDAIINFVRSYSGRWEKVILDARNSPYLFHDVLNDSQDFPARLESLDLSMFACLEDSAPFDMRHLLPPENVTLSGTTVWALPCSWKRLTRLETDSLHIDELLWIIQNAPNLTHCTAIAVESESFTYDLPTAPIVSHLITYLHNSDLFEGSIFGYLTLPSLNTLVYDCHHYQEDESDIEDLVAFLERSSPSLQDFHFIITPSKSDTRTRMWCEVLPSLTSVEFDTSWIHNSVDESNAISAFLAGFESASGTMVLPNLRYISFDVETMSDVHWSALCDILEERQQKAVIRESATEIEVVSEASIGRCLLSSVDINEAVGTKLFESIMTDMR